MRRPHWPALLGASAAVALAVGLTVGLSGAHAAPVPIPPVPVPPLALPALPAPLDPVVGLVSPTLAQSCGVYAALQSLSGLGVPAVGAQLPQISFQYVPSYVGLTSLPCSAVHVEAVYACSADAQLGSLLESTEAQLTKTTGLPVSIAEILPIPTTVTSTAAETVDAVVIPAGQGGQLDKELSSLGCVNSALLGGVTPVAAPSTAPTAPTTPTTAPPAPLVTAPSVLSSSPTGGSGVSTGSGGGYSLGSNAATGSASAPADQAPVASQALVASPQLAATHADTGLNALALMIFFGVAVVGAGLWIAAGSAPGSAPPTIDR